MIASWMAVPCMTVSWMTAPWMAASWMTASWMAASWMAASWMTAPWMAASWIAASWMAAPWITASWMTAPLMATSWMASSWMATYFEHWLFCRLWVCQKLTWAFFWGLLPCVTVTAPWLLRPMKVFTKSELYPHTFFECLDIQWLTGRLATPEVTHTLT